MSHQRQAPLDRDKLRAELRRLSNQEVWSLLDHAVDLLPPAKLRELFHGYVDLRAVTKTAPKKDLLSEVRAFDQKSRRGEYYESFNVNSKNYMDSSRGTLAFVADYNRLLDRCVKESSKKQKQAEALDAFEILFSLVRYVDEAHDDVVFLVKEGVHDVLGADWNQVFPAWFTCLSANTEPDEYARRVVETVRDFDGFFAERHLKQARRVGTAAQRKALQDDTRGVKK